MNKAVNSVEDRFEGKSLKEEVNKVVEEFRSSLDGTELSEVGCGLGCWFLVFELCYIKRLSFCYIKLTKVKLLYVKLLCEVSDKNVNMNSVDGMWNG